MFFNRCSDNPSAPLNQNYSASFNKLWNDFDRHYSYFVYKNIDWDRLKSKYQPYVQENTNYGYFIWTIKTMLSELHDLHISIITMDGNFIKPYYKLVSKNYDYNILYSGKYFIRSIAHSVNGNILYGDVADSIGYVLIKSWRNAYKSDINGFGNILDKYKNYKALIMDVRPNNGGSELLAQQVAGRFTTGTKIYAYDKSRNGPQHSDFTEMKARSFSPTGSWQFTKPVALLIGNVCMSSNEAFILMMSTLDNVITIGDTTRGSSGNPKEYMLVDGTKYFIPRWVAYKSDKTVLEDVGIFPDVPIKSSESIINKRDKALDKAIEVME